MNQTIPRRDQFIQDYKTNIFAGISVVFIKTLEPFRAEEALMHVAVDTARQYYSWDMTEGWKVYDMANLSLAPNIVNGTAAGVPALDKIKDFEQLSLMVMQWPHFLMEKMPPMVQKLAQLSRTLPTGKKRLAVIVPPNYEIPMEIREMITLMEFDTPDQTESLSILEGCLGTLSDDKCPEFEDDEIDGILAAAAGLTEIEAENAFSRALITHMDKLPNLPYSDFVAVVSKAKTEAIKRSDVLELMEVGSPDDIGGLENLKQWVKLTAHCMAPEAVAAGVDRPKGVFLAGAAGCLVGSTQMWYNRGRRNSGRFVTLKSMYEKFNGLAKKDRWKLDVDTRLQSWDYNSGELSWNDVISVTEAGVKPCVVVTVDSGEKIKLTANHPIATPENGFKPAGELSVGEKVLLKGDMMPVNQGGKDLKNRPKRIIVNTKYHPNGAVKYVDDHENDAYYEYYRVPRAVLVVEARMNEMSYDEFVHALNTNHNAATDYRFIPKGMEVHHIDCIATNDRLDNLMVCTKEEHAAIHGEENAKNFHKEFTVVRRVVSVESAPAEMTYDVQMRLPHDNFVADGFVVHNTGKSASAKAIAGELKLPLIKFDLSRVFSSLVGSSEARIKSALKLIEAMAPACVVGNTMIKLSDGTKKTIKELFESNQHRFSVSTIHPETGAVINTEVRGVIKRPAAHKRLLKIKAGNRQITVTDDHRLLVIRDASFVWVEAKDLTTGDDLVTHSDSLVDYTEQCFGNFTVTGLSHKKTGSGSVLWNCRCALCGKTTRRLGRDIKKAPLCSCEVAAAFGERVKTHGMSNSPAHKSWLNMRRRCSDPKHKDYPYYGDLGISVCDRWEHSFDNFHKDMGDPPHGHTLDRIDSNRDYSPENCRWSDHKTQMNNTTRNRHLTAFGETKTMAQWAEDERAINAGVSYTLLRARLRWGWGLERALVSTPNINRKKGE